MPDWDGFQEAFRYDLWANLRWLEHLNALGMPDPDKAILAHHAGASLAWLGRLEGISVTAPPVVKLVPETFQDIQAKWEKVLTGVEGNPTFAFKRFNGDEMSATMEEIARQVSNHGSYHRGELRGLARARGDEEFPETDFIMYRRMVSARNA